VTGVAGERNRPLRYDLIQPIGLRRLAETCAEGAAKHGDTTWERLRSKDHMNRALAHLVSYQAGDRSEDHLAHAAWRLFALMHFEERPCSPTATDSSSKS
jgi:hypothetical protein